MITTRRSVLRSSVPPRLLGFGNLGILSIVLHDFGVGLHHGRIFLLFVIATIHGHGLDFLFTQLVECQGVGRRNATAKLGGTLQKAASTDTIIDVVFAEGQREDYVIATAGRGSAAADLGFDESDVAAVVTHLADFVLVGFIGGDSDTQGSRRHGTTAGMAKAQPVFFLAKAHFHSGEIQGRVAAAAGVVHASSWVSRSLVVVAHDVVVVLWWRTKEQKDSMYQVIVTSISRNEYEMKR